MHTSTPDMIGIPQHRFISETPQMRFGSCF